VGESPLFICGKSGVQSGAFCTEMAIFVLIWTQNGSEF
jgi:hypothetical protein